MDNVYFILKVLMTLFLIMAFTKLLMVIANYIGQEFRIADFFIKLWEKISNKLLKNKKG